MTGEKIDKGLLLYFYVSSPPKNDTYNFMCYLFIIPKQFLYKSKIGRFLQKIVHSHKIHNWLLGRITKIFHLIFYLKIHFCEWIT